MKILFLNDCIWLGGVEKSLINILDKLDKSKYDMTLCTIFEQEKYKTYIPKGIKHKFIYYDNYKKNNKLNIKAIIRKIIIYIIKEHRYLQLICKKNKYDIVISFKDIHTIRQIKSIRNKNIIKYGWIHTDHERYDNIEKYTPYFKLCNKIICVSETAKQSFINIHKISGNVDVKYNPVNLDEIKIKSKDKIEDRLKNDKFKIISVGRLDKIKGYDRLIKICNQLIVEGFDFELWIVGDGEERQNLEGLVKQYNIERYIKLLGFKSNPYKYMNKCNLFVCSSYTEGYSTVVVESLALKLPVITTECSGMKEILGDSEYGLIVENNSESLYKGIKTILENKTILEKYIRSIDKKIQDEIGCIKAIESLLNINI